MSGVDRSVIQVVRDGGSQESRYGKMSRAEALCFVWELTREVYSLTGKHDVESRLRRDIVTVTKIRN